MTTAAQVDAALRNDLVHRGVHFTPPNGRTITCDGADLSNFFLPDQGRAFYGSERLYLGGVYHSTEDRADANDQAVAWFNDPAAKVSADWYVSADGDIWHIVPRGSYAWAQGTKPQNDLLGSQRPSWMIPDLSYNAQLISIESEGYAHTLQNTLKPEAPQWDSLAYVSAWEMWVGGWEGANRWLRHQDLSRVKADPGPWFLTQMPALYSDAERYLRDLEVQAQRIAHPVAAGIAQPAAAAPPAPPDAAHPPPPAPAPATARDVQHQLDHNAIAQRASELEERQAALKTRVDRIYEVFDALR